MTSENFLTHNILWYEDLNDIYITPDVEDPKNILVNYENNDHSKIIISCNEQYRLSLNLKNPIESIDTIIGKQIVLKKKCPEYWKVLTKEKNNKVKTDWNNLNIESCYEVEEIKVEELDLDDDLEKL